MINSEPFQIRDGWIRVDSLVDTYAEIAENAFALFLNDVIHPAPLFHPQFNPDEFLNQDRQKSINGIKTIVFSAMAIEAAAFDLAASQLGDKVATQYLDKMDLLGKWMIVPRLVCGRSLREDGPAVNALRVLIKARNGLVHPKSKEWDRAGKAEVAMIDRWTKFEKDQVPNAFKTLVLLSLELDALLNTLQTILPSYEELRTPPRDPLVKDVVQRCRMIHRDANGG